MKEKREMHALTTTGLFYNFFIEVTKSLLYFHLHNVIENKIKIYLKNSNWLGTNNWQRCQTE